MTRALLAVAAFGLVLAMIAGCEPAPGDDRTCSAWYDQYKCKNAGDKCDEVAVQLSADTNAAGGMCVDYKGKVVCAPVRKVAGPCEAVESCDYQPYGEDRPLSCNATCVFIDGTAANPNEVCALP